MISIRNMVKNILRKELLIPVKKIKSQQVLTSDLGLSPSELNILLYFVEEKYKMRIVAIQPKITVQELIYNIEQTRKYYPTFIK